MERLHWLVVVVVVCRAAAVELTGNVYARQSRKSAALVLCRTGKKKKYYRAKEANFVFIFGQGKPVVVAGGGGGGGVAVEAASTVGAASGVEKTASCQANNKWKLIHRHTQAHCI